MNLPSAKIDLLFDGELTFVTDIDLNRDES